MPHRGRENEPSHKATKLAAWAGSTQQDAVQRAHAIATTPAAPPTTLFANQELRSVTLSRYTPVFSLPGGESGVYFNFAEYDNLVLSRHVWLALAFMSGGLGRLHRASVLEVEVDDSRD
ncbi:hypothetical protein DHEL01_v200369 [Diaporthe helianthi]|uniref:Uncharacterized protein n=1 Tax=Diaporthe helianthi TaxID=158607 RepID=A0A2P5IFD2_DIAHE|nr:hypothetical protein DHEL01_v200369 [Diaporthe helianthi]